MRRADRHNVREQGSGTPRRAPSRPAVPPSRSHNPSAAQAGAALAALLPAPRAAQSADFGALFRDLRRHLQLSLPEVATLLQTHITVVSALETGKVEALPAWPETVRVVSRYTGALNIDPRPVLDVMRREMGGQEGQSQSGQAPTHRRQASGKAASWRRALGSVGNGVGRRLAGKAAGLRAALPIVRLDARRWAIIVAVAFVSLTYFSQGSTLQASLATLHPPLARLVRGAEDYLLWRAAPQRGGLKWIEVDDPRSRRTDKQPQRQS